jgi:Recombinase
MADERPREANAERRAANLRAIVDDLRSQGITSVRAIASQLNERGIPTPRDGAWHPRFAARLLSRASCPGPFGLKSTPQPAFRIC